MAIERTRLECHACGGSFSVDFDTSLNGNHVVRCPKCDHDHCRVIQDGKVTGIRWDRHNGRTYHYTSNMTTYTTSSLITSNDPFLASSWVSSTGNSTIACCYIWNS